MLKTTESSEILALKTFKAGNNEVVGGSGDRDNETVVNSSKPKNEKSRKLTCMPNIGIIEEFNFLTPNIKKALKLLRLAFIKVLILQHFDLKNHICIKINISSYTINKVLS